MTNPRIKTVCPQCKDWGPHHIVYIDYHDGEKEPTYVIECDFCLYEFTVIESETPVD